MVTLIAALPYLFDSCYAADRWGRSHCTSEEHGRSEQEKTVVMAVWNEDNENHLNAQGGH